LYAIACFLLYILILTILDLYRNAEEIRDAVEFLAS